MKQLILILCSLNALGCLHDYKIADSEGSGGAGGGSMAGEGGSGGAPVCMPRAGDECSTSPLCGCAPEQNCEPSADFQHLVCGKAGKGVTNDTCNNSYECAKGSFCANHVCTAYCSSDADCQPNGSCKTILPGLKACFANCDPLDPAAVCGFGKGCIFYMDAKTTYCTAAGTGIGPGACANDKYACAPKYMCSQGDCVAWCRIKAPGCTGGKTCQMFTDDPMFNGQEYGGCN